MFRRLLLTPVVLLQKAVQATDLSGRYTFSCMVLEKGRGVEILAQEWKKGPLPVPLDSRVPCPDFQS